MKKIRKHLPTALFIIGFIAVLGLVGETPLERKDSTAYVRETMEVAKQDALARAQQDNWQQHVDWAEQFTKAPQIALK
jgi:hypothetical protein